MVELAVLAYLAATFLFKDAEFVEEHGQTGVVLKVHQDFADVNDLVLYLPNHFIVWRPFVATLVVISKERNARISCFLALLTELLLFVFIRQIKLSVQDLYERLRDFNELSL